MRLQRLVFGEDAELYDRVRPSYPAALIAEVVGLVGAEGRAVDVGCGTAKAAVLLAARGVDGIGVEPDARMAAVARRNLLPWPGWRVDVAEFETWGGEQDFDLVTCAQAWHWLDPAVRLRRAHDLLRPGGWLALWWNRPARDHSALRRALDGVYGQLAPHLPARGPASRPATLPFAAGDGPSELDFAPAVEHDYLWSKVYSAEEWVQLLQSSSDHRLLENEQRQRLLDAVARVIREHGGSYRHQYVSRLWSARRL